MEAAAREKQARNVDGKRDDEGNKENDWGKAKKVRKTPGSTRARESARRERRGVDGKGKGR